MKERYKIMIVEDEDLFADKMEMQIDMLGHDLLVRVDNSVDALAAINKEIPDLILMDVNIEGDYDGIELTDLIHEEWPIPIIFITSYTDDRTFKRISRTNPVGFIQKPFDNVQLRRSIALILQQQTLLQKSSKEESEMELKQDVEFIFIKNRSKLEKIKKTDIFFLEADGKYCQVFTINKKFLIRMPMKEIIKKLDPNQFVQTHRSYIVNLKKVKTVDLENSVVILENRHIPLSRREKDGLLDKLEWI